jgi:uncharacterized protein
MPDELRKAEVIKTTIGKLAEAAAELARRGLSSDDQVTITIEPAELIPGRREARACRCRRPYRRRHRPADRGGPHRGATAARMRVVVYTNVFVSAALKEESPPGTAAHFAAVSHVLLKSTVTEQELLVTLSRPRLASLIPSRFQEWLRDALAAAELVAITERIAACRDPKDDKFLELAVSGKAEVIVSGDGDLLELSPFRGIPMVTPATFVRDTTR